jgi:hypothetical protein
MKPIFYVSLLFVSLNVVAQQQATFFTQQDFLKLKITHQDSVNKIIPAQYRAVILTVAQYYPELNGLNINYRIKKQKAPLSARPTVASIFRKPQHRKYVVTISNKTISKLQPILFDSLSYNAQLGVIGHEMGHIADFNTRGTFYFIQLFIQHLNRKYMDRFEYKNDARTIAHGLGYQLLSWSTEVRAKLKLQQWGGTKIPDTPTERYMNPETILKYLNR